MPIPEYKILIPAPEGERFKKYFALSDSVTDISSQRAHAAFKAGVACSTYLFETDKAIYESYSHVHWKKTMRRPEDVITDLFISGFCANLKAPRYIPNHPRIQDHYVVKHSCYNVKEALIYGMIETEQIQCDTFRQRFTLALPYFKLNKHSAQVALWDIGRESTAPVCDLRDLLLERLNKPAMDGETSIGVLLRKDPDIVSIALQVYEDFLDEKVNFTSTDVDILVRFIMIFNDLAQNSKS